MLQLLLITVTETLLLTRVRLADHSKSMLFKLTTGIVDLCLTTAIVDLCLTTAIVLDYCYS